MKKKILIVVLLVSLMVWVCGCGSESEEVPENVSSNQEDFLWQLSLVNAEIADNLANTQVFIQYDGVAEEVPYAKSPSDGNTFLLLELNIDKTEAGGQPFSWSDTYVMDGEGNQYKRHENDTFLEDYNLPRLKATDLTIGSNTGFVCFEIPVGTDTSNLKFVHEAAEGENVIAIPAL